MRAKQRGEYHENWSDIAQAVKADANGKCVRCGHKHEPSTGYCLTVHHFDGNKSNNGRWNLIPLCQRCHLSVQQRVDPDVALMFEPALWAMPYIAGLYEARRGLPGPLYRLSDWIDNYVCNHAPWPVWAVIEQTVFDL